MHRRDLIRSLATAPFILRGAPVEPSKLVAVQCGDVTPSQAVIWVRSNKDTDWEVRCSGRIFRGSPLTTKTDRTGRVILSGMPAGQRVAYEVRMGSESLPGSFLTPGSGDIRFLWSGDMVGQGWGINPDLGGIRIFETMRKLEPHFFIHSGDTIYADSPVPSEIDLPGGGKWRNITTPEKSKVAETLDEFRGAYRYNLLDHNVRQFGAEVAQVWQWDDHEFTNNWSPTKDLTGDDRYKEKNIATLLGRARQAFLEYAPFASPTVYRKISYGPLLDLFVVDMRTYRGANTYNRERSATAFLGRRQIEWLKAGLRNSTAVWKVIAADMPVGLLVPDGKDAEGRTRFEAIANGDGPALGREIEVAGLLRYLKQQNIRNTVWLTADVHYTAAHYYDPAQAQFTDFLPFWEFVSGPLNAGTFGPGTLDGTFGPRVVFEKSPPKGKSNLPPSEGMQFFGDVKIESKTRELTVTLRDLTGAALYSKTLGPHQS